MSALEYTTRFDEKREDGTIALSRHIWNEHQWRGSLTIDGDRLVVMHAALHSTPPHTDKALPR